jgi:hypothetical protein
MDALLSWSHTWIGGLKQELSGAIRAFEMHEAHLVERAGPQLTELLARFPTRLAEYAHGLERTLVECLGRR